MPKRSGVNPQPLAVRKLGFHWANNRPFSFDLGGVLRGGDIDAQEFLAECKNYDRARDQGVLYDEYLAKCYRAYALRPERCDNFMWVTWAAFATTRWDSLMEPDTVRAAVEKHVDRVIGNGAGRPDIDDQIVRDVAERLWMIVLSERQERYLVLTAEHRAVVEAHIVRQGAADGGL